MTGYPLAERLLAQCEPEPNSGCHLWIGTVTREGYGHIVCDGRTAIAHRVAYEQERGPIPHGLTLDHLCRNRRCVNPHHLEAVTMRENILRGDGLAAHNARKIHCGRCHSLEKSNGERRCPTCQVRWSREAYLRHRKPLPSKAA